MLKIVEKKVRTSLPAVYRLKKSGDLVLFFKPNRGVRLNGVYVFGFRKFGLDCVNDPEWERVKVRIKTLPMTECNSFPNVLRSKRDGKTVLFLSVYDAFELDVEGCRFRPFCEGSEGFNYAKCIDSGDWDAVDLTFK